MKRIKYHPIWVASLAWLGDTSGFACSCLDSSPADSFAAAREVFAGTVIDIVRLDPALPSAPDAGATEQGEVQIIELPSLNRVTFQVNETWKGSNTITKVVLTGQGNGDCGVPFMRGSDYIVYTSKRGSSADPDFVHACSGTSLNFLAASDLEFLGAGQKPIHPLLNVRQDQGTTTLSWQTNWTNFRLEAAVSLQPPVMWQGVSNEVSVVGGFYTVTNAMALPHSFFRLAR